MAYNSNKFIIPKGSNMTLENICTSGKYKGKGTYGKVYQISMIIGGSVINAACKVQKQNDSEFEDFNNMELKVFEIT